MPAGSGRSAGSERLGGVRAGTPRPAPSSGGSAEPRFRIGFEQGAEGLAARLGGDPSRLLVVVVDVLSFSTAVSVALDHGVVVVPAVPGADAAALAAAHDAVLAGRRGEGPSLSPGSLTAPGLERVVLPSPNGATLAVRAADAGATVVAGCIRNAAKAAAFAGAFLDADRTRTLAVVAAGERWPSGGLRPALEDQVGAGRVLAALGRDADRSPEAAGAAVLGSFDLAALAECVSARELIEAGFADDVDRALEPDAGARVPFLTAGRFQAAASPEPGVIPR